MKSNQPLKQCLDEFVISVCVRYRKGMSIESAVADSVDDDPWLTVNAVSKIRNAAIRELKSNSDWRYDKLPTVL